MNGSTEDMHALPRLPSPPPPTSFTSHSSSNETKLLTPRLICTFCQLIFVLELSILSQRVKKVNVCAEASLKRVSLSNLNIPSLILRSSFLKFQRKALVAACGPAAPPHTSEAQTFKFDSNSAIYGCSPAKMSTAELDLRRCVCAHRGGIHAGALGPFCGAERAQPVDVVAAVWLPL